nr:immunoglobulin heavy chain junction region [Mus musculus]MBK4188638.1 immunoglobulin heavy chain junction region [Mus musculus]MBK4188643.1 immunoglobulin heavy chain junction region [Mus musculus]
CFPLIGLDYW